MKNLMFLKHFYQYSQSTNLTARKYLRSLSENALHYRPTSIKCLS